MKLIENTIQTTRRIMNGLRPEQLEILGFVDAVKQYLCEFEERHGIVCMLDSNVLKIEMNSQKTLALFRILQESMTNVARHSKATQVYVKIHQNKKQLIFSIADNGTGFDMSKKAKSTSYGMIGMYERVTLIDGKLRIKSKEGAGTSVVVKITN
jgi:signal transduction histidine kinase